MIATIVNISETKFSFNGIPYFKNFISVVYGDKIRILNTYSNFELLPVTDYDQITVDGSTYASAALLQEALLPVLFTRSSLAGITIEGDITSIDQTGDIITFTLADTSEVQINLSAYDQSTGLSNHINDTGNPHNVDASDIGLGNVDNTSDANKPISDAQATVNSNKADRSATMVDINSSGSKEGLYVFGVKAGINDGNLIIGWKVKSGVTNPTSDADFETPYGYSQ
tara:strand:+ start:96 stop:776 length:681 start_codon:yes stop_codon:yes gene_type:complete